MQRNLRYILAIIGVAAISLMIMDFNSRMSELSRLERERGLVSIQVTELAATQSSLETQMAYATSEGAVVERALGQERLVRPGDVLVVPLAPGDATPVPTPTVVVTPVSYQNWQYWYILFFDTDR